MQEEFEEVVEESTTYRIEVVTISPVWDKPHKMYKLIVKSPVGELFVQRDSHADYGLRRLKKIAENYSPDSGFLCNYGAGHPIDEFEKNPTFREMTFEALPLEWFTWLEDFNGFDVKRFGGNHKNYSGAFRYYVWDRVLIMAIQGYLAREGVVASRH